MPDGASAAISRLLRLNGVFGLRKPAGETSAATVERVKSALLTTLATAGVSKKEINTLKRKVKVGHGGTLDPLASGVLVIGIGNGCKMMSSFLNNVGKSYRATGRFGEAYDTYDRTGIITFSKPYDHLTETLVRNILVSKFTGEIMQRPPAFSALHVNGQRAYEISRKRQEQIVKLKAAAANSQDKDNNVKEDFVEPLDIQPELELPERPITIERIDLKSFSLPEFILEVDCTSGTYIRSIIHDLGLALQSAATMWELERTAQGPFKIEDCLDVKDLNDLSKIERVLKSK